jgi:hypothetical protein
MRAKEKISLLFLITLYLLVIVRYFPDRPADTFMATMRHLLDSVPYIIAMTILTVSIMQRVVGAKLPHNRIVRIYLMFGLIAEFFFGIYHYASVGNL